MISNVAAGADPAEPRHSIAVVAARTGLSQDVIRAWERRYGVVEPARTTDGRRLYSDADVERLRLVRAAASGGRRVADVARESTTVLAGLVTADRPATDPRATDLAAIDRALELIRHLDGPSLAALLRRTAADYGAVHFLDGVVAPLLRRIGDAWHAGRMTIAEEHFASAVIEDVVREMTRSLAEGSDGPVAVAATLAGNRHGMGAALAASVAAAAGWTVLHLGEDLPVTEVASAAARRSAAAVLVSVVYAQDPATAAAQLRDLRAQLPAHTRLLAGGGALAPRARALAREGLEVLDSLDALRERLRLSSDRSRPSPS